MALAKEAKGLTRRGFLEAATLAGAAGVAGGVLAGCSGGDKCVLEPPDAGDVAAGQDSAQDVAAGADLQVEASVQPAWDEEFDVVVAGAGGAGLVAALAAAEAGASVLLLEKRDEVGGATGMSGGIIHAAGTQCQKAAGVIDDTPEKHAQYWLAAAEGWVDEALVRKLAEDAPAGVAWLAERGMTYSYVYAVDDIPLVDRALMPARLHIPTGAGEDWKQTKGGGIYTEHLRGLAEAQGVVIRTASPMLDLVASAGGGVAGVVAQAGDQVARVRARRGVVLATGGFSRNVDMAREYAARLHWEQGVALKIAPKAAVGDGIRAGRRLGAALAGLSGSISYPLTGVGRMEPDGTIPGIWINRHGQRFVNEAAHYGYVMREVYRQEAHLVWAVWDQHGADAGAAGEDFKADTLEGLAQALGVPPDALARTVAQWNQDVAGGADRLFLKAGGLQPVDTPPFRAGVITYANVGSLGGLRIDVQARVLDQAGVPIPRLYAAGMTAGGFIGEFYPGSGTAITATLVFGRLAGAGAAAEPVAVEEG
jgi:fumarate reductase flavoprotein subunit